MVGSLIYGLDERDQYTKGDAVSRPLCPAEFD